MRTEYEDETRSKEDRLLPTEHIWCVVPVFNNNSTVREVAMECRSRLQNVVVVDDGSTDADVAAMFAGTDIMTMRHEENRGKGQAILTALRHAASKGGRFIVTIDADGQHFPADLEKFIPLLQEDETSIVIGVRKFRGEHVPGKSRFGRKVANFWLSVETGVSIADAQSGFRAYPVRHLSNIETSGSRYEFETEILAKAVWAGLHLRCVEIDVDYPHPELRNSSFRPLWDNLRISGMHARLVARRLLPYPQRRLLPREKKLTDPKLILRPAKLISALLKENASPPGLAASAAVGMFLAVLPLISLHTVVILYVATRLHLNKVMALNIQHLAMPPFIPAVCILLGYYIRHGHWLTDVSFEVVFGQLSQRLLEWLIGSIIVAPVAAALVGFCVYCVAKVLQERIACRAET